MYLSAAGEKIFRVPPRPPSLSTISMSVPCMLKTVSLALFILKESVVFVTCTELRHYR